MCIFSQRDGVDEIAISCSEERCTEIETSTYVLEIRSLFSLAIALFPLLINKGAAHKVIYTLFCCACRRTQFLNASGGIYTVSLERTNSKIRKLLSDLWHSNYPQEKVWVILPTQQNNLRLADIV